MKKGNEKEAKFIIMRGYHNGADIRIFNIDTKIWDFAKTTNNYFGIPIEIFLRKYEDQILDIEVYYPKGCPPSGELC